AFSAEPGQLPFGLQFRACIVIFRPGRPAAGRAYCLHFSAPSTKCCWRRNRTTPGKGALDQGTGCERGGVLAVRLSLCSRPTKAIPSPDECIDTGRRPCEYK